MRQRADVAGLAADVVGTRQGLATDVAASGRAGGHMAAAPALAHGSCAPTLRGVIFGVDARWPYANGAIFANTLCSWSYLQICDEKVLD